MSDQRMPFRKFTGRLLAEVPSDYLGWLLRCCNLRTPLRRAVEEEVERRGWAGRGRRQESSAQAARPDTGGVVDWAGMIRQWHRELVRRWHPDRGGTKEAAQAIADAHALLKELVGVD
jgi:hypothetical protein